MRDDPPARPPFPGAAAAAPVRWGLDYITRVYGRPRLLRRISARAAARAARLPGRRPWR